MKTTHHWHILGAGSMGLLWAYYLAGAGHKVSLLTRNDDEYQRLNQLTLTCNIGGQEKQHRGINIEPPHCNTPIKHLLICVKAQQTAIAAQLLVGRITDASQMLLLQNGLGSEALLRQVINNGYSYLACTTEACKKLGNMQVAHTGIGKTFIGGHHLAQNQELAARLSCKLSISACDNIQQLCFKKLIANCVINPLTALHNCLNGELLEVHGINEQIKHITHECLAIAKHQGIHLNAEESIASVIQVIRSTAKNSSSMREDYLQRRPTEISFINGYIVSQAQALGINVPYNQHLFDAISTLDAKRRTTT